MRSSSEGSEGPEGQRMGSRAVHALLLNCHEDNAVKYVERGSDWLAFVIKGMETL